MNELSGEQEETDWINRGVEIIERMTGKKPRGFRAPTYQFSRYTASILCDLGFKYDASLMDDDVPSVYQSSRGEIIGLPSHWALDDWPQYVCNSDVGYRVNIRSPDEAKSVFMREFEIAHKYGGMWIAVWHPWVSARLARAETIREMIESMQEKGDVWFATMEQIAEHIAGLIENDKWQPRRVTLPYYNRGLPDGELPTL